MRKYMVKFSLLCCSLCLLLLGAGCGGPEIPDPNNPKTQNPPITDTEYTLTVKMQPESAPLIVKDTDGSVIRSFDSAPEVSLELKKGSNVYLVPQKTKQGFIHPYKLSGGKKVIVDGDLTETIDMSLSGINMQGWKCQQLDGFGRMRGNIFFIKMDVDEEGNLLGTKFRGSKSQYTVRGMNLSSKSPTLQADGTVTFEDGYGIIRIKISKVYEDGTKANGANNFKCEIPPPTD